MFFYVSAKPLSGTGGARILPQVIFPDGSLENMSPKRLHVTCIPRYLVFSKNIFHIFHRRVIQRVMVTGGDGREPSHVLHVALYAFCGKEHGESSVGLRPKWNCHGDNSFFL